MLTADTGPGFTLAEEFFLIAHDDRTGRALLGGDLLAVGLAGSVLAGLVLAGRLTVLDRAVALMDSRPVGDPIGDPLIAELRQRAERRSVRAWIEYLCDGLTAAVAEDLAARGLIRIAEVRHPVTRRRTARYPAVDAARAVGPRVRLGHALGAPAPVDARTALLAEIVRATGLDGWFVDVYGPPVREQLARIDANLPRTLRALLTGVDEAVTAVR
ncbi:Golgi phosphoprotein 3 (GPP34) [Micromonospora pattaloongensis]|uniref:Golgi phosphoprotein 3 (GPP34) n=1 Tax=Micromonospora pattaloongensis TaxID=405436 RepID=A0A1H3JBW8_9ACTN|nr:GPP34 family phosphoprotein [Micromonospora pattaloongensis]SDY37463.1 Golgi phosphoprotein 3 (GPP34) [Micromonospora pattaloongensis]